MKEKYEKRLKAHARKQRRASMGRRSLRQVRNVSLVMLSIVLLFLFVILIRNVVLDLRSRSRVAELQKKVAVTTVVKEQKTEIKEDPEEEEKGFSESAVPEVRKREEGRLLQYQLLYQENNDLCGWLRIPDTVIDYPVMHLDDDNDFYLSHDFRREEDVNGLLVLDKRCSREADDTNLLIHGHNMRSGFMFGSLKNYKEEDFFRAHPTIWYDTLYHEYTFTVYAVFLSSVGAMRSSDFDFYDYIQINNEQDFDTYINGVSETALYKTNRMPKYGDQLLTLSTCDYTKEDGRLVIVAYRTP